MSKKKKYYVVWEGVTPGIYEDWTSCQLQISGFPGAKYKSFKTKAEAEEAYSGSYLDELKVKKRKAETHFDTELILENSISVDAACSGNPGDMEYRGVITYTKEEIFRKGPFKKGTNNIGEFLALVHALALLKKQGDLEKTIYTDSRTAMSWIKHKRVKTTLKKDRHNAILFTMMERAVSWLKTNEISNPIVKWNTKEWGEIPADFGRK